MTTTITTTMTKAEAALALRDVLWLMGAGVPYTEAVADVAARLSVDAEELAAVVKAAYDEDAARVAASA